MLPKSAYFKKLRMHYYKSEDEEFLQSVTRLLFFTIVAPLILMLYPQKMQQSSVETALALYGIFTFLYPIWIFKRPGLNPLRRTVAIVADMGILSFTTYTIGLHAILIYPLYIWVVMGNGIRYGEKYFYLALATALLFLTAAVSFSPFWSQHTDLSTALILGLALITLLNIKTYKRIHMLNKTLKEKVDQRIRQLEYEYHHDSLTGLLNRTALEQALKHEPFSGVVVIDIDGFRNINELYGMRTGNEILVNFATELQGFLKNKPFDLYRIYSDVFAIRGKMKTIDLDIYELFVDNLLYFIENIQLNESHYNDAIKLDVTLGISLEKEDSLNKAEMALSYAKANTKKYIAYSKIIDSSKSIQQLLQRKNEIKEAIQSDNFVPVFQPIVNRDQKVLKYEALIRMRKVIDGKEQLVSPYFFLDAAVKTKQYETLTLIMIEKSFQCMHDLREPFSINLSFNDLLNEKVIAALKHNIEVYGTAQQFTVEVLESENVEDYRVIDKFIKEFKRYGVEIAIDDFGSGFSNFTHLFELEPDILKIDGTLIKNIDTDEKSYEFVKSIVQLAKALQIKTLAEFVSSKEIFEITYDLGIDYFQGYYFSPPLTYEALKSKSIRS